MGSPAARPHQIGSNQCLQHFPRLLPGGARAQHATTHCLVSRPVFSMRSPALRMACRAGGKAHHGHGGKAHHGHGGKAHHGRGGGGVSHSRGQQPERRKGGSEAGSPPCAWPAVQNRSRGTRHSGRRGVGGRKGRRDLATCHPPPFNAFPPCQLPPRRRRPRPRPWRRRCTRLFQPPSRRGWRCRQRPEGGGGEQGVMQGSGCGWRGLT